MTLSAEKNRSAIILRQTQMVDAFGQDRADELWGYSQAFAKGTGVALLNAMELVIQIEGEFPGETDTILKEMDRKAERLANFKDKPATIADYVNQLIGIILTRREEA